MTTERHEGGEVVLFQAEDGKTRTEVQLDADDIAGSDQVNPAISEGSEVISCQFSSLKSAFQGGIQAAKGGILLRLL